LRAAKTILQQSGGVSKLKPVQTSQQAGPVAIKKPPQGTIGMFAWRPFPGFVEGVGRCLQSGLTTGTVRRRIVVN
jgi:hypothetical protein